MSSQILQQPPADHSLMNPQHDFRASSPPPTEIRPRRSKHMPDTALYSDIGTPVEESQFNFRRVPVAFDPVTHQSVEGVATLLDSGASSFADHDRMTSEPLTFVKDSVEGLNVSPPKKKRKTREDDGEYQPPGTRRVCRVLLTSHGPILTCSEWRGRERAVSQCVRHANPAALNHP